MVVFMDKAKNGLSFGSRNYDIIINTSCCFGNVMTGTILYINEYSTYKEVIITVTLKPQLV